MGKLTRTGAGGIAGMIVRTGYTFHCFWDNTFRTVFQHQYAYKCITFNPPLALHSSTFKLPDRTRNSAVIDFTTGRRGFWH